MDITQALQLNQRPLANFSNYHDPEYVAAVVDAVNFVRAARGIAQMVVCVPNMHMAIGPKPEEALAGTRKILASLQVDGESLTAEMTLIDESRKLVKLTISAV